MRLTGLHVFFRNSPQFPLKIDFIPNRKPEFTTSASRPVCWVLAAAIPAHRCPGKHRLDSLADTGGRFSLCRPDGFQDAHDPAGEAQQRLQ